eukprot:TRINITY_DN37330_c0_g1_i1.p1 TRINITY_DN37330_c0_g1~~TRINITY_DN37330_c0_g1_i1.p1  ORF type:complete len:316 (-),score=47.03 TRINITY_DN37330_c0_g1_i1:66-968(-)
MDSSPKATNIGRPKRIKPKRKITKKRAACVTYQFVDPQDHYAGVRIALVSSRTYDDRWILPGGTNENNEPVELTAEREVAEEGGFYGVLEESLGVLRDKVRNTKTHYFAFKVEGQSDKWYEMERRKRKWVPLKQAFREVLWRKDMAQALLEFRQIKKLTSVHRSQYLESQGMTEEDYREHRQAIARQKARRARKAREAKEKEEAADKKQESESDDEKRLCGMPVESPESESLNGSLNGEDDLIPVEDDDSCGSSGGGPTSSLPFILGTQEESGGVALDQMIPGLSLDAALAGALDGDNSD